LQPLILNFVTAPHACSERAIRNSPQRRFNEAQHGPSLAASLVQRLLRHADDAPIRTVLRGISIQGLCFLLHTAQTLPGLMTLEFKLLFQPFNACLFHCFFLTFRARSISPVGVTASRRVSHSSASPTILRPTNRRDVCAGLLGATVSRCLRHLLHRSSCAHRHAQCL
jgi:hypothetical protein